MLSLKALSRLPNLKAAGLTAPTADTSFWTGSAGVRYVYSFTGNGAQTNFSISEPTQRSSANVLAYVDGKLVESSLAQSGNSFFCQITPAPGNTLLVKIYVF